jgi:hypothetical protein
VVIGLVAGTLCCVAAGFVKEQLGIDDSLDVFGVHGLGGMIAAEESLDKIIVARSRSTVICAGQ